MIILNFWVATKPSSSGKPAADTTKNGDRIVYYQAGAPGPHLIALQVIDKKTNQDGKAGILIDITDEKTPSASVPVSPHTQLHLIPPRLQILAEVSYWGHLK